MNIAYNFSNLSSTSPAWCCMSVKTWEYVSKVIATVECPSIDDTIFAGIAFFSIRVAFVCLRS